MICGKSPQLSFTVVLESAPDVSVAPNKDLPTLAIRPDVFRCSVWGAPVTFVAKLNEKPILALTLRSPWDAFQATALTIRKEWWKGRKQYRPSITLISKDFQRLD